MIPVEPQPEYAAFDADVREPGRMFLKAHPNPRNRHFRNRNYWGRAKKELVRAYKRCAYTSLRPFAVKELTVDHFLPRATHPCLAYEWDNYRLALKRLNQNKGDSEDVVDPFHVRAGWFVLDVPSCWIRPGDNLDRQTRDEVDTSINVLKLNENDLATERAAWLVDLAAGELSLEFVRKRYAFLAFEVERQGIEGQLKTLFALNKSAGDNMEQGWCG